LNKIVGLQDQPAGTPDGAEKRELLLLQEIYVSQRTDGERGIFAKMLI
jgi:hypothetical protein